MTIAVTHGIEIDLDDEATDDPITTIRIRTPNGVITVMAEASKRGRSLELLRLHIHSDVGPHAFGPARLRTYAQALMELADVDEIMVVGAERTTGAGPGNRARRLRFTRKAPA